MMGEGLRLRRELARELAKFGRAVSIAHKTAGTYNADTGLATTTSASYSGMGRVGYYSDKLIDGTMILRDDRQVTWQPDNASESFRPSNGDVVSYGSEELTVVSVKEREVGGEWFAYTLQCRK